NRCPVVESELRVEQNADANIPGRQTDVFNFILNKHRAFDPCGQPNSNPHSLSNSNRIFKQNGHHNPTVFIYPMPLDDTIGGIPSCTPSRWATKDIVLPIDPNCSK